MNKTDYYNKRIETLIKKHASASGFERSYISQAIEVCQHLKECNKSHSSKVKGEPCTHFPEAKTFISLWGA